MKTETIQLWWAIPTSKEIGTQSKEFSYLTAKQKGHLSTHDGGIGREKDLHGQGVMCLGRWLPMVVLIANRPIQGWV